MKKEVIQTSDGMRAVYRGAMNGNPLLFCIHGGMGLDSNSLIPYFKGLSGLFDLVFIDLRGHGESNPTQDGRYRLQDFSRDVREIVQKIKHNQACGIFGHSLGGMVAIQALADDRLLFDFAILSNTALDSSWQKYSKNAASNLDQDLLGIALQKYAENQGNESLKELAVVYGALYFPELSKEIAEKKMTEFTYRDDANSFLSENVYSSMNLAADVRKITTPTLVISGDRDLVVPIECQMALVSALKNGKHEIVSGAGHFPFVTETIVFNRFVSNWWDNVRRKKV